MTDPRPQAGVERIDAHQHFWDLTTGRYAWPTAAEGPIFRSFGPADLERAGARRGRGADLPMTAVLDQEPALPIRAEGLRVVSLLGSFRRARPVEAEPVHALVRWFRAGDAGAIGVVDYAGLAAIERDAALRGPQVAAVVVPGHDGALHPRLLGIVTALAPTAGWTVAAPEVLSRRTAVTEAKRRLPRDRLAEAASLHAGPASLPASTETILLVDDVLASGATLDACVAALRRDGWTRHVMALVIAVAR